MNNDHQINKMFVAKIENMILENQFNDIEPLLIGLEEMLTMHRNMETDMFYPWFDESLGDREKENVIDNLKEI
jgi:hypothetical protein